jgi:hypothetical protein
MGDTATETTPEPRRRRTGRSPSYPALDLEAALERVQTLYETERRYPAAIEVALRHLGYNSVKSGGGQVTLAALRYFGLIEAQGSGAQRTVRVTDLAEGILLDKREDSTERLRRIREAALLPPMHAEMWKQYGADLPSPDNLRFELVRNRGFTESGADDFITEYRRTIQFARLAEADANLSEEPEDKNGNGNGEETDLSVATPEMEDQKRDLSGSRKLRSIQLPYSGTGWATLQATFPLADDEWEQMLTVLQAMKPALTERPEC